MIAAQFDAQNAFQNRRLAAGDERLGPLATCTVYAQHRSRAMLREVYPVNRKLYPPRDAELVRGIGDWNGNVGKGMDDTPMREHSRKLGEMDNLDKSCMKAWSLEFLERMAAELERWDDQQSYRLARQTLKQRINETFSNEEQGIYRNRYISGQWPVTEGPTGFYPWLTGAPTSGQSGNLLSKPQDPKKLWGEFVLVSLAKDDPQNGRQATEPGWDGRAPCPSFCYWRGNISAPSTYLYIRA
jgi:hypothetical protein